MFVEFLALGRDVDVLNVMKANIKIKIKKILVWLRYFLAMNVLSCVNFNF